MRKFVHTVAVAMVISSLFGTLAIAQDDDGATAGGAAAAAPPAVAAANNAWINIPGSFGVGLTVIGAGYGIGRLAASAVESQARQPEVAGAIQTAMIIAAALIEGFTFYALYICSTQNPWPPA